MAISSAWADSAQIDLIGYSDEGSQVSATMILNWDGQHLIALVSNTSSDQSVITGFGLMGGEASTALIVQNSYADFSASGTQNDPEWYPGNNLKMAPMNQFGTFDFGADSGPGGLNSGDPASGILAGTTAEFRFLNLTSTHKRALDFLETANANGLSVAMRFQSVGVDLQESAKLGGIGGIIVPSQTPTPAPGAVGLAFIGLTLVSRIRRRLA